MPPFAPTILTAEHDLSDFDCGKPNLNDWLKRRARNNQALGFTAVVVLHDAGRVFGYYGLAPTSVEPRDLPRRVRTGQPPTPVPCLLLGQFAIDLRFQGLGYGDKLALHALERAVASADIAGGRALLIRAIDEEACQYWRRWSFLPSPNDPMRMVRSLPEIRASLRA